MMSLAPMPEGYCDLHCHLLPNVDDGAKTLEDALEMARPGYHTLVCSGIPNEGEAERLALKYRSEIK